MNEVASDMNDKVFLKRLLLIADGSPASENATGYAMQLAQQLGCRLTAAYVIDTAIMDYLLQMHIFVSEERQDFEQALEEKGRGYLQRVTTVGAACQVPVDSVILRGAFHKEVTKFARNNAIDAIVIGGWRKSVRGKDAFSEERELVMGTAECPVFVVNLPVER